MKHRWTRMFDGERGFVMCVACGIENDHALAIKPCGGSSPSLGEAGGSTPRSSYGETAGWREELSKRMREDIERMFG